MSKPTKPSRAELHDLDEVAREFGVDLAGAARSSREPHGGWPIALAAGAMFGALAALYALSRWLR
jgi:hypothetical protein